MTEPADLLRESWHAAGAAGDDLPKLFYAALFDTAPAVAALFPADMRQQRRHLVATLGHVVRIATGEATDDEKAHVLDRVRQLGRDHRRYGAEPEHYPVVGDCLILALSYFVEDWTDDHAKAWVEAYGPIADVMAAAAAETDGPPWVDVTVADVQLEGGLLRLALDEDAPGVGDVWVRRPDRDMAWRRARIPAGFNPAPVLTVIHDSNLDDVVLSQIAQGGRLRIAPVYDQEAHGARVPD